MKTIGKIKLPNKPGVYIFKKNKDILYIGKATSLRDRVKSYFRKDLIETRGPILVDMVFKAGKIDYQATDSVLEALILEANLIKKHQPKYNTKEKDDKSFNVVCITKETFPKVLVFRERNLQANSEDQNLKFQAKYGPFTNGAQLKEAMKIIRYIFPYLDAKSSQPNNLEFYRQIGLAPDTGTKEAQIAYGRNIKNLKLFFEGKKKRVISNFKKEMMQYAKNKEFERANEIKQRIFALAHINDIALIKNSPHLDPLFVKERGNSNFRIEAYDIAHMGGKNMVGVMTVVEDGEAAKSEYKKFSARGGSAFGGKTVLGNSKADDTRALTEIIDRRLAHKEWAYPNLIVVDGSAAQINAVKSILSRVALDIPVVSVVKDEKHKPKAIMGNEKFGLKYKREILLANSEAHRFAIAYHKKIRNKNFLI